MRRKSSDGWPTASEWVDPNDAPELTEEFFEDAEWFEGKTFIKRGRGRPPTGNAKEQISVRLDQEVLAKLRAAGPGWQSQINPLLRHALALDRSEGSDRKAAVGPSAKRRVREKT